MARKRRSIPAHTERSGGIAYDLLAREVMQSADFQRVLEQMALRLRQEVLQQLVQQPLRQFGAALGTELSGQVFGAERFAPSDTQIGALLHDLLAEGESIL